MDPNTITRRGFVATISSVCATTLLAGCSSGDSTNTQDSESATQADTATSMSGSPATATSTPGNPDTATETVTQAQADTTTQAQTYVAPDDEVGDGLVEGTYDWQYVRRNLDEFQGVELTFPDTKYSGQQSQDLDGYEAFAAFYQDPPARVFMALPDSDVTQELDPSPDISYRLTGTPTDVTVDEVRLMYLENASVTEN